MFRRKASDGFGPSDPERQPVPGFAPARIPAVVPGEAPFPPGSGHGPMVRGNGQSPGRAASIAGPPRDSVNIPRPTFPLIFLLQQNRSGITWRER